MRPLVRCTECGYFSVRHLDTRLVYEVEREMRHTGRIPANAIGHNRNLYDDIPICIEHAVDFATELDASPENTVLWCISHERECAAYTPWLEGLSPKEHREMQWR